MGHVDVDVRDRHADLVEQLLGGRDEHARRELEHLAAVHPRKVLAGRHRLAQSRARESRRPSCTGPSRRHRRRRARSREILRAPHAPARPRRRRRRTARTSRGPASPPPSTGGRRRSRARGSRDRRQASRMPGRPRTRTPCSRRRDRRRRRTSPRARRRSAPPSRGRPCRASPSPRSRGRCRRQSSPACSSALRAAGSEMSDSASSGPATRRSWMPVRATIHSSDVSTIFASSLFVSTRSGTAAPRPVIETWRPVAEPITDGSSCVRPSPRRSCCRARRARRPRARPPCSCRSGRGHCGSRTPSSRSLRASRSA